MATFYPGITYVIPCGAEKLDRPAPARDLYTGQMFRHALRCVERIAADDVAEGRGPARVLVLSGRYGLVELDQVLEPYEQRITGPGAVTADTLTAQADRLGIGWDEVTERGSAVYAFLPAAYLGVLDTALRALDVYVQDVYEGSETQRADGTWRRSIGGQRRVLSLAARPGAAPAPAAGEDGGPVVWIGGDVHAFAWGEPILVSYGRLRDAQVLPVATAPWVCDSRGFTEIREHGAWTIPAERYAADLRRYAAEVGHLVWAAPQDWPATAELLARTGLDEAEHQRRTIASTVRLRQLAPDVPVMFVVTGRDVAGYLRHLRMYQEAGVDLRAEPGVIGVGALVGRPAREVVDIITLLHAAGLRRLHGFGVKGRALDLVGPLLESVDSAAWSAGARHRGGACTHGEGVRHERNCPHAARTWAAGQRTRAARAAAQEMLPLFAAG